MSISNANLLLPNKISGKLISDIKLGSIVTDTYTPNKKKEI